MHACIGSGKLLISLSCMLYICVFWCADPDLQPVSVGDSKKQEVEVEEVEQEEEEDDREYWEV